MEYDTSNFGTCTASLPLICPARPFPTSRQHEFFRVRISSKLLWDMTGSKRASIACKLARTNREVPVEWRVRLIMNKSAEPAFFKGSARGNDRGMSVSHPIRPEENSGRRRRVIFSLTAGVLVLFAVILWQ